MKACTFRSAPSLRSLRTREQCRGRHLAVRGEADYKSRFDDLDLELNPQNCPEPLIGPSPSLSAEDAVRVQLEAMVRNDLPFPNHGVTTAYSFARDSGSMERSQYFGFSKDLYHMDHYLGQFLSFFGFIEGSAGLKVSAAEPDPDQKGGVVVRATVRPAKGPSRSIRFALVRGEFGMRKGCWLVRQILEEKNARALTSDDE